MRLVHRLLRCNNVKLLDYKLELICILAFTVCSSLWVISLKEDKATSEELNPLIALEKLVPQHKLQLLNANFGDQLHYDQLAQLQSELETLVSKVNLSESSKQLFNDYNKTSLNYIQLTSMLKTSQRLISDNSQIGTSLLLQEIEKIRLEIFSYISTSGKTNKAELSALIRSIEIDSSQQLNWRHLQLVKLHSLFILDNFETTAKYRQSLIDMPVIEAISKEQAPLQQRVKLSTFVQIASIFGVILSLVMLFFVFYKRHEDALKKTLEQRKEIPSNMVNLSDSRAGVVEANTAVSNTAIKRADKPLRILKH